MSKKEQIKEIIGSIPDMHIDDAADAIIALFEEPQVTTQDTKPDNPPPKPPGS